MSVLRMVRWTLECRGVRLCDFVVLQQAKRPKDWVNRQASVRHGLGPGRKGPSLLFPTSPKLFSQSDQKGGKSQGRMFQDRFAGPWVLPRVKSRPGLAELAGPGAAADRGGLGHRDKGREASGYRVRDLRQSFHWARARGPRDCSQDTSNVSSWSSAIQRVPPTIRLAVHPCPSLARDPRVCVCAPKRHAYRTVAYRMIIYLDFGSFGQVSKGILYRQCRALPWQSFFGLSRSPLVVSPLLSLRDQERDGCDPVNQTSRGCVTVRVGTACKRMSVYQGVLGLRWAGRTEARKGGCTALVQCWSIARHPSVLHCLLVSSPSSVNSHIRFSLSLRLSFCSAHSLSTVAALSCRSLSPSRSLSPPLPHSFSPNIISTTS